MGLALLGSIHQQLTVNVRDPTEDNQGSIRVVDIEESSTQLNVSIIPHGSI